MHFPVVLTSAAPATFCVDGRVWRKIQQRVPSHQLTVPPHRRVTYGGRAFAVAGPSTWYSLPKRLRDPSSSACVLGRLLKTFLFSEY